MKNKVIVKIIIFYSDPSKNIIFVKSFMKLIRAESKTHSEWCFITYCRNLRHVMA